MYVTSSLKRRLMVAVLAAATLLAPSTDSMRGVGVSNAAADVASGATLTVLAPPVEIAPSELEPFAAASQAQLLQPGAVVRTGRGGLALLTFFDGSETQLAPESQIQLERAAATPSVDIALLQTAGVSTNHIVPMGPGGNFETDTPGAVGLVRGTSYVVAVPSLGRPALNDAPAASDGDDAASQPDPSTTLVAAASGPPRALPQQVVGCSAEDTPTCLTLVVLLADPGGRVGRVVVEPRAPVPPIELANPGELGAVSARAAAKARLSPPAVEQLQQAARDLRDTGAADLGGQQVQQLVEAVRPVVGPESPAEPAGGADDAAMRQPETSLMVVETVSEAATAAPGAPVASATEPSTSLPGSPDSPAPGSTGDVVNTVVPAVTSPSSASGSADPTRPTLSGAGLPQTTIAVGSTPEPSSTRTTASPATPTPSPEVGTSTVAATLGSPASPSAVTPATLPTAAPTRLATQSTSAVPSPSTITARASQPAIPTAAPTPVAVATLTANTSPQAPSAAPTASTASVLGTAAPTSLLH